MFQIVASFGRFCIAENQIASRQVLVHLLWAVLLGLGCALTEPVQAQAVTAASSAPAKPTDAAAASASAAASGPQWFSVLRARVRLRAADIGLVINTADPYSVAVGNHYLHRRRLRPQQVLRVDLPLRGSLTAEEFEALRTTIQA